MPSNSAEFFTALAAAIGEGFSTKLMGLAGVESAANMHAEAPQNGAQVQETSHQSSDGPLQQTKRNDSLWKMMI